MMAHQTIYVKSAFLDFEDVRVFEDFSASFSSGEIVAIMGPSGSGKSTLLRVIAGLQPLDKGNVLGVDRSQIEFMFQQIDCFPWLNVKENLALGARRNRTLSGHEINRGILRAAQYVGLSGDLRRYPMQLSGGMRKRVAVARALLSQANIMLLDEPLASLDPIMKMDMEDLIRQTILQLKGTGVLVTHEIEQAVSIADKVFVGTGPPFKLGRRIDIIDRAPLMAEFRKSRSFGRSIEEVRSAIEAHAKEKQT